VSPLRGAPGTSSGGLRPPLAGREFWDDVEAALQQSAVAQPVQAVNPLAAGVQPENVAQLPRLPAEHGPAPGAVVQRHEHAGARAFLDLVAVLTRRCSVRGHEVVPVRLADD